MDISEDYGAKVVFYITVAHPQVSHGTSLQHLTHVFRNFLISYSVAAEINMFQAFVELDSICDIEVAVVTKVAFNHRQNGETE